MYKVKITNNGVEEYLYHPADDELLLLNPVVTQKVGRSVSFEFQIAPEHPLYSRIYLLTSRIAVYDDNEILYRGRPIGVREDFYGIKKISCEGEYSYLVDSMIRPFSVECSVGEFFKKVIGQHNSQVDAVKQFVIGDAQITGDSDKILFESTNYQNTYEVLMEYLVNVYGGYIRVRLERDRNFIDYVSDYGGINEQPIRFGENLLDLSHYIDPTQIFTAMIPTGGKIVAEDDTESVVTIESVNGGKDYIFDQDAVNQYGWIFCRRSFENVTDPAILLSLARMSQKELFAMPDTITANAIDLGLIDVDISKMKTGYWTDVVSPAHNLSKKMMLRERTFNLLDPTKDKVVLGREATSLSGTLYSNNSALNHTIQKLAQDTSKDIIRKIENATNLITGGKGGYVVLDVDDPDTGKRALPWRILIMDTPDKETAKSVIQINKNGLGFSTTGINGPYRNAWTIDGNLVADFITAGTMLADRIRGGTYEVGGAGLGRDGSIVVMDAAGKMIGSWDKTGLTILKGILQGVSAVFGGVDNQNGAIEVKNASGRTIGRWDKDGLYMQNGTIDVGPLYVDDDYVQIGDYEVSTDGTNELVSINGFVKIDCMDRPAGSPGGKYASLYLGGQGYRGVEILGTGQIKCGGLECRDVDFSDPWTEGMSALDMFRDLYNRINALEDSMP